MNEEDLFLLECSSGCESGWTTYLDRSSLGRTTSPSAKGAGFHDRFVGGEKEGYFGEEEEERRGGEEEDLSMVSDASSGPPHFHEEEDCYNENGCFLHASPAALMKSSKRRRAETEKEAEKSSFLDDTASSHVFCFSKNIFNFTSKQSLIDDALDFSIGFSATHFKKHYDIVRSSSVPLKHASAKGMILSACRKQGGRSRIY